MSVASLARSAISEGPATDVALASETNEAA